MTRLTILTILPAQTEHYKMSGAPNYESVEPHSKSLRLFFFWTGVIATIAYRIVIVLNAISPLWVKVAWYVGTIGFVIYFWHRYDIASKRARLVKDYNLIEAIDKAENIEQHKKSALHYLIETSLTSKARWNEELIFILSAIALIIGIVMDILGI